MFSLQMTCTRQTVISDSTLHLSPLLYNANILIVTKVIMKDMVKDNWPICYDHVHDPKNGEPCTVPMVLATEKTLAGFGMSCLRN